MRLGIKKIFAVLGHWEYTRIVTDIDLSSLDHILRSRK